MILALDVGNSQIYGGVFAEEKIQFRFRKTSKTGSSSDEFGIFLRSVLRENGVNPEAITQIGICSVVPEVVYSLRRACEKYFDISPFFLQAGVKTGLKVKYHNPLEVGSDRIANAIAAVQIYPKKDLIIVDLGTATTFCAVSAEKEYLGGVIIAGLRLCRDALEKRTAKLPSVEILASQKTLGQNTVESIQSGLYYGHLGQIKEISTRLAQECFNGSQPYIVGTGGFSNLFDKEKVFNEVQPDLVLKGLMAALELNSKASEKVRNL